MARRLGVRQGHVWAWLNRNKSGFPAELCKCVEAATNGAVTRHDLRPDIFGPAEHAAGPDAATPRTGQASDVTHQPRGAQCAAGGPWDE